MILRWFPLKFIIQVFGIFHVHIKKLIQFLSTQQNSVCSFSLVKYFFYCLCFDRSLFGYVLNFGLTPSLAPRPLWPHTYFGPKHTSAQGTFRPEEYFSPNNTSAQCLLWPGNTSARDNFDPIHFGQIFNYQFVVDVACFITPD